MPRVVPKCAQALEKIQFLNENALRALEIGGKQQTRKTSEIDSESITAECMFDEPATVWTQQHSNYCKDRWLNELGNSN